MGTLVTFNGSTYTVPIYNDPSWAQGTGNLSSYLIAIASGCLQTTGGSFTLSAEVNFGATFGIVAAYHKTTSASPATTGVIRLAATDTICWDVVNNALGISGTNLTWNGATILTNAGGALQVSAGGTGRATLTAHAILIGEGTSGINQVGPGNSGVPLLGAGGAADPAFGALSLAGGATVVTGTLPVGNGGTNSASSLSGNTIMISNGSAIVQGAAGTTTTVLHGNAGGSPSYSAVSLTADVTGTLGIGSGGTGQTTASAAINALLPSRTRQVLTSGTGATYTTPANCRQLFIRMVGGGGGGGEGNSGGNAGGAGGTTIFNSINANGGGGGAAGTGTYVSGGIGGNSGTGAASLRIPGQDGFGTAVASSNDSGKAGGNSMLGFGAMSTNGVGRSAAANSGGGGAGGGGSGSWGGSGGGGEYVELIINSPSGTYTYTVGAAGAAGTGTVQPDGGAGGSGVIIVDEYY